MATEYDIIVVGAGLIGSAAARHLVEISKHVKVLLIGPEEPKVGKFCCKNYILQEHMMPGTIIYQPPPPKTTKTIFKSKCNGGTPQPGQYGSTLVRSRWGVPQPGQDRGYPMTGYPHPGMG